VSSPTRLLGIDYGNVRVGLAISDPERRIASPLTTWTRRDPEQDAQFFQRLFAEQEVGGLVLGLPVHLDGREGQKAQEARAFGRWLQSVAPLPVIFWDERFTTAQAESFLWGAGLTHKQRRQRRDRVAAQILLQTYLDAGCPPEEVPTALDG
jgi:putative holliday junction resolvase